MKAVSQFPSAKYKKISYRTLGKFTTQEHIKKYLVLFELSIQYHHVKTFRITTNKSL